MSNPEDNVIPKSIRDLIEKIKTRPKTRPFAPRISMSPYEWSIVSQPADPGIVQFSVEIVPIAELRPLSSTEVRSNSESVEEDMNEVLEIVRYECTVNKHSKYWEVKRTRLPNDTTTVPPHRFYVETRWGKIGNTTSNWSAKKEMNRFSFDDLVASKLKKGYVKIQTISNKAEKPKKKKLQSDLYLLD